MKKIFFIILTLSATVSCFSQKIDENIIDDFTGKQKLTTKWEYLGPQMTNIVCFRFRYESGTKYFDLVYRNGINDIAPEGMAIQFKTQDGIKELKNSQATIVRNSTATEILRYIGDMDFFSNSCIDKFRVHFSNGYDDYLINDYKGRKYLIGKCYKLFLDNINIKAE